VNAVVATTAVPVPDSATDGLVAALLDSARLADLAPALVGVKVMLTWQEDPAVTLEPQVVVSANIAASVPATEIPLTTRGALPVLASVTTRGADGVPTGRELKARLV